MVSSLIDAMRALDLEYQRRVLNAQKRIDILNKTQLGELEQIIAATGKSLSKLAQTGTSHNKTRVAENIHDCATIMYALAYSLQEHGDLDLALTVCNGFAIPLAQMVRELYQQLSADLEDSSQIEILLHRSCRLCMQCLAPDMVLP